MKKKLITSALPYVNNVPHLGNIIGSVLSADVFARYCRSMGYETFYICATDEYGTATENKARELNLPPEKICDTYHQIHKRVYEFFNISFDYFGRTSFSEHKEITQELFLELDAKGFFIEKVTEQSYCSSCETFLADRLIEGICPYCLYEEARGDQCEHCGKLLQPQELQKSRCKMCNSSPVTKETAHLYLNLPQLQEQLQEFTVQQSKKGFWTKNAVSITENWINDGLQARPITRDLRWGISVPKKGYENKVFYVWFDAVLGYTSNTKRYLPEKWQDWWQNNPQTELYQFMAKDNVPFHTIVLPAIFMASDKNWTMLHHINSTEYLNYESGKFSKSQGVGIFGDDVIKMGVPVDLWRFYLLINRPETSDAFFYWENFYRDINNNFIDTVGNFCHRIATFLTNNCSSLIPLPENISQPMNVIINEIITTEKKVIELLEKVCIREGLKEIVNLARIGNKLFQEQEPWKKYKEHKHTIDEVLYICFGILQDIAILLQPYMPDTSKKIFTILNIPKKEYKESGKWHELGNHTIETPQILYKKLEQKHIQKWKQKFEANSISFSDCYLLVGKICSAEKHPNADKLYIEKIDCGEGTQRTVVSGLAPFFSIEELIGKKVIVVANLETANIRGIDSQGMILAAETQPKKIEIIEPPGAIGKRILTSTTIPFSWIENLTIKQFQELSFKVENYTVMCQNEALLTDEEMVKTSHIESGTVK